MPDHTQPRRILLYQSLGFLLIILLSWLDAYFNFASLVFGRKHFAPWHEALIESQLTLLVGIGVLLTTRRLISQLLHLKSFIRMCAWCRHIEYKGQWIPVERYLAEGLNTNTSHGICPECHRHLKNTIGEADPK